MDALTQPTLPCRRKAPRRYKVGDGESHHSNTVEDHYRQCYFEAIDLAVTSIELRFNQPGYLTYQNFEELLTKAANKEDYTTALQEVLAFYGDDFDVDDLSAQLEIFGSSFTSENDCYLKRSYTFFA